MRLRDSGALTDAEFATLKAKLIHGQAQAPTRSARSSVPAVAYPCDSRDHPETAERAYRLTRRPLSQEEAPQREGSTGWRHQCVTASSKRTCRPTATADAAQQAFDQVVDVCYALFDARVDHEWARAKRCASAPIDDELKALLLG